MKKVKKNLVKAINQKESHPTESLTKIEKIFNIDRHSMTRNAVFIKEKQDSFVENQSNKKDEFLYQFSLEEMKFINDYLSHPSDSYSAICKRNPIYLERRTLQRYLSILGKEKTEGKSIKYHYDRQKFKEIQTEEDAYWLGFLTADGCIIKNKWVSLGLAERDLNHIKKFCSYMGLNSFETEEIISTGFGGAYTKDNPVCSVKFCSLELISNLENKGLTPSKSGKEKPQICSTIELQKAYVRGLIDGDGYIRSTQYGMGLVGSYEICQYVQNFITKNITDVSANHIREHGVIFKLEINGRVQTKKILDFLYGNANIYLQRKQNLYLTQ